LKIFLYARSGHNIGLDRVRRASAICNMLEEYEPTLCTSDFRAANYAKDILGVKKALSVDVIHNMSNVMPQNSVFIYDSDEVSSELKAQIDEYTLSNYSVGSEIEYDIVDMINTQESEAIHEKAIFYGDDDYDKTILSLCKSKIDIPLLMGHYFFLGIEDELKEYFSDMIDEEEHQVVIKQTQNLLTSSIYTALESLSYGNRPIFFARADKEYPDYDLLEKYNIPVVTGDSFDEIIEAFDKLCI
jgi:hypothetical protein